MLDALDEDFESLVEDVTLDAPESAETWQWCGRIWNIIFKYVLLLPVYLCVVKFCVVWCIGHVCPKIICSLDKLLQFTGHICQVDKLYGCSVKVFGVCMKGHCFIWESSDVVTSKAGGRLYLDNLNFTSLILSGNNYRKIMVFARFYGLHIIGVTTFHGYQCNIICHGVDTFYKRAGKNIIHITLYNHKNICHHII